MPYAVARLHASTSDWVKRPDAAPSPDLMQWSAALSLSRDESHMELQADGVLVQLIATDPERAQDCLFRGAGTTNEAE